MIGGIGGGPQIICVSVALPLWLCNIQNTSNFNTANYLKRHIYYKAKQHNNNKERSCLVVNKCQSMASDSLPFLPPC